MFRRAMRGLASGVTIISAGAGSARRGLTATSICSLSDDPPSVVVCIRKATETHRAILDSGAFSIQVLSTEHEIVAERFAGRHGLRAAAKFDRREWTTLPTGSSMLSGAVAFLECVVLTIADGISHSIFIGLVREVYVDTRREPLVYCAGSFGAFRT